MATTVPAVMTNLAAALRLRAGLAGVGVHTIDRGDLADNEAIILTSVDAPRSWIAVGELGLDEEPTVSGYLYTRVPGTADSDADTAHTRAGALLDELAAQLAADATIGGALGGNDGQPMLTSARWTSGMGDQDGTSIAVVQVTWQITWADLAV